MRTQFTVVASFLGGLAASITCCASAAEANRRTKIQHIGSYLPRNDVADQFALDKDLTEMENLVLRRELNKAKKLYIEGGNSMPYASVTIINPHVAGTFVAGEHVVGTNDKRERVFGKVMESVTFKKGETVTVKVLYTRDEPSPTCSVGALHVVGAGVLTNCFTKNSTMKINGTSFQYAYDVHTENLNALSLQSLALNASAAFDDLEDFEIYKEYYGTDDYADRWAMAAADSASTGFPSGFGNADFALLQGRLGHGEGLLKGAAYLNVYMFVLGKLGLGVKYCVEGHISQAEYALDEAVAYYTGSLADRTVTDNGRFIYALADKRCQDFKTCGHSNAETNGTANVNLRILSAFKTIQLDYGKRNTSLCSDAANNAKLIGQLMKIPIIQSVLAYGYIREYDEDFSQDEVEKAEAKGATYSAAILPYLNQCMPKYAGLLYDNMRVGSITKQVSYVHVREALEECYEFLGITCDMVGGIWDQARGKYSPGGEPCGGSKFGSKSKEYGNGGNGGMSAGGIFGLTTAFVLCGFLLVRYRNKLPFKRTYREKFDMSSVGTIAAVSEIS